MTETADSRSRVERYDPIAIEPRWQDQWATLRLYETDLADATRPKYYLLTMYPYPSGDLHIGHWYIVTPSDALARYRRMHGYNVFFPIGFDAFGLPAENAAIKSGGHPYTWTMSNIENMRRQFRTMGAMFSWEHEVVTADPSYYQWNQWMFLRFLEKGLAYRAKSPVDWCPNDGTLAREQVEGDGSALLALWRARREARPGPVVPAHHRLRRRVARLRRDRLARADPHPADQLDRSIRGRRDRLHDRRRPITTPAARPCACSRPAPTRCSGPRSWSSRPSTRSSRR